MQAELGRLEGHHTLGGISLAFSADGRILASGGSDGIRLWDIETQEQVGMLQEHHRCMEPAWEIESVDVTKTEGMPGVVSVLTADNQRLIGVAWVRYLTRRYEGEEVAVVIAETREQAEAGARAIEFDFIPNEHAST